MKHSTQTWIRPEDERWKRALAETPHDVYHSPDYVELTARQEGGEPIAFLWESRGRAFLLPLVLRSMPPHIDAPTDWRDAVSPYGYASPLVPPGATPEEVADFLHAFIESAAQRDLVTAFLRIHPLLSLPEKALRSCGTLVRHGSTIYLDLREPLDVLWSDTRPRVRTEIRKLNRAGFAVRFDEWDDYDQFIDIYHETMQRVVASDYYQFEDRYFHDLRKQLGDNIHLATVHDPDGKVASAGLFFTRGDFVQYHLGGTHPDHLSLSPAKLLFHGVRTWAKARGHTIFHLGGGVGGSKDSLYQFKAGFSPRRASYHTLRIVIDPSRYHKLAPHAASDDDSMFPAYRAQAAPTRSGDPMQIPMAKPDILPEDIDEVVTVLRSGTLALGPRAEEFEQEMARRIGVRHALAVSSGTAALHLAVRALDIGPGDEVLVPSYTFAASVNAILFEGATPIFVDIEPDTYNLDLQDMARKRTPRTRAVLGVDVFGHPAAWDDIVPWAREEGLHVIDDSCEALGAKIGAQPLGSFGDAATFAFYPNKQMTTGEGGMLVTSDDRIARIARSLRNQGRSEMGAWLCHERLGYNYRMDEMSAALGVSQLRRLDAMLEQRARVAGDYTRRLRKLPQVRTPLVKRGVTMSWFVYVVTLENGIPRDEVMRVLEKQGVPSRAYFEPIHLQSYVRSQLGTREGQLPMTEDVAARTLALPFFNVMRDEQVAEVVDALEMAISLAA